MLHGLQISVNPPDRRIREPAESHITERSSL